jgi:hypothetical protein
VVQKQIGPVPDGARWTRFSILASSLGITTTTTLTGLSIAVYGGEAWFDLGGKTACAIPLAPRPQRHPYETLWFDDDAPAGATLFAADDAIHVGWQWTTAQAAVGTRSQYVKPRSGGHQSYLFGATEKMNVPMGDLVFVYALLDPCNPPRQLMLELYDGAKWSRLYWGEDLAPWTDLRRNINMGPLPAAGQWTRLEVPASLLTLDGASVGEMAFTLFDGAAWFDAVGTIPRVNLALGKPATQSTDLNAVDVAAKAVDGNVLTFQHTNAQSQPWLQVDLGARQAIDTISVWNRADCCQDRTQNFWVFVSDAPIASPTVSGARAQAGVRAFRHFPIGGRPATIRIHQPGRYVRVQLESASQYLSFGELQVWAPATEQRVNLAGGSSGTTQASILDGAGAERAVDGRTAGFYDDDRSTSHTNNTTESWWEIDLGAVQPLSRVDLFNQVPVADRLREFYVFVSDVPFVSTSVATTIAQPGVSTYYYGSPMRPGNSFDVNRTGRYVRVQLSITNYLVLGEVQIWPSATTLKALVRAPGGGSQ